MANKKSPVSISHRRRAIHMGLKQYLQGEDLYNALCIWQQHYAQLPRFAITNFVRRITEETSLAGSRAAIHLSLTSSLMLADDALGPDPLPEMRQFLARRVGAGEAEAILGGSDSQALAGMSQSDTMEVFETLLDTFLTGIATTNKVAANDIRSALMNNVTELVTLSNARTALTHWLSGNARHLQVILEAGQLQQLLHQTYVLACDRIGPVRTDRCLSDALQKAENTDAGQRVSPRDWL